MEIGRSSNHNYHDRKSNYCTELIPSFLEKVGAYYDEVSGGMVLDESDRYEVPLGYNKGVEGIIRISSGSDITLDIYDNNGDLYSSYSVGSSPVGFSFSSNT